MGSFTNYGHYFLYFFVGKKRSGYSTGMIKIPGPIPIFVSPFFWVMAIAIGWLSTMSIFETFLWVCVIFVSVLFHEFGHALTAVGFGQKVIIELTGYGGLTIRRNQKPFQSWKEFLIGLNGPLAGFLLCGIAFLLSKSFSISHNHQILGYMLSVAFFVNLYWTSHQLASYTAFRWRKIGPCGFGGFFWSQRDKSRFYLKCCRCNRLRHPLLYPAAVSGRIDLFYPCV